MAPSYHITDRFSSYSGQMVNMFLPLLLDFLRTLKFISDTMLTVFYSLSEAICQVKQY